VGAQRPQRVLVGAKLAEIEPVAVDVEDVVAELAVVGQLLERAQARVVLEQVADHQRAAGSGGGVDRALRVGDLDRKRLLDEAVLAGLEHRDRELGMGRDRGRERDRVQLGIGEQVVELGRHAHPGELSCRSLTRSGVAVAAPAQLAAADRSEVAGEVRSPVPEPGNADADRRVRAQRLSGVAHLSGAV